MSLFFYGVCILGAVLGGLVLLVLYSLLVMAQRGDAMSGSTGNGDAQELPSRFFSH